MNLTYLKYFLELAKIQHYGRAAELLGISQPGLSHAIAALEKELGMPLFKKDGRNIALNRFGKMLMPEAEKILPIMSSLKSLIFQAFSNLLPHINRAKSDEQS